jgi:hypothetical protein
MSHARTGATAEQEGLGGGRSGSFEGTRHAPRILTRGGLQSIARTCRHCSSGRVRRGPSPSSASPCAPAPAAAQDAEPEGAAAAPAEGTPSDVTVEPIVPTLDLPPMPAPEADFSADKDLFLETTTDAERARREEIAAGDRLAEDGRPVWQRWPRLTIGAQAVGGLSALRSSPSRRDDRRRRRSGGSPVSARRPAWPALRRPDRQPRRCRRGRLGYGSALRERTPVSGGRASARGSVRSSVPVPPPASPSASRRATRRRRWPSAAFWRFRWPARWSSTTSSPGGAFRCRAPARRPSRRRAVARGPALDEPEAWLFPVTSGDVLRPDVRAIGSQSLSGSVVA